MITLLADRPSEAYPEEMDLFGRFAGLWQTHVTYLAADGSPARHADGDWEFGYALEGRAVIDVWQVPGREALAGAPRSPDQECGLCVRIWNAGLQLWRFTFHGTARGDVVHMFAREIGDEIVMEGAESGELVRWVFSDIDAESFSWRSEHSQDGGRTWRRQQDVRARRALRREVPSPSTRGGLAAVLPAPGPHASLADQAPVFDRFVGTWDCDYTHFATDGDVSEHYAGEVTFGWIIDGHAMQDVWIGNRERGEAGERSIGTSIRFFDPAPGLWTVVWFAPEAGVVTTVRGGERGDRIVLEGDNADGSLRRWSFNDMRADSFVWRGERSTDRGKTWSLTAEYRMKRRPEASLTAQTR